ncbi:hypothetical protein ABC974_28545 [Sphingomonas oligophenolica]|uniref:Uncharacterized protein n=1 Tax=Sphingomonas oligophenolica TaxID=301154 RepID=A0ABU9YCQ9_9SPHN
MPDRRISFQYPSGGPRLAVKQAMDTANSLLPNDIEALKALALEATRQA